MKQENEDIKNVVVGFASGESLTTASGMMKQENESTGNTCIGPYSGSDLTTAKNCVLIGDNAGFNVCDGNNLVIIGDNVSNVKDPDQDLYENFMDSDDTIYIGHRVAIGRKLFGRDNPIWDELVKTVNLKKF